MAETPDSPAMKRPGQWIAGGALVAIFAVVLLMWIEGTRITPVPADPTSVEAGVSCQVVADAARTPMVRCVTLVDAPPERVWQTVTDYDHFPQLFSAIRSFHVNHDPDGRFHLTYLVSTLAGRWPVDVHVRHTESPERFVAAWDEPSGRMTVNRGSWTVTPAAQGRALLTYTLDMEISRTPTFLVRDLLLASEGTVVRAVAAAARGSR